MSVFSFFNNKSNTSNQISILDIPTLNEFIKIKDRATNTDEEMSAFIKKNQSFFSKKIPFINNGTILHALSYGGKHFKQYDTFFKFSKIIDDTITYFYNPQHTPVFSQIVNLNPNPCTITDDEGFTPYDIAILPNYNNTKMQKLLCNNCNSSGGKRKRRTKRYHNKKKKTRKRQKRIRLDYNKSL